MGRQDIIDQLNAYDAEHNPKVVGDIWQDVILKLADYDEAGTDRVDPSFASDRFALTDGTVIRYDAQAGRWYEQS